MNTFKNFLLYCAWFIFYFLFLYSNWCIYWLGLFSIWKMSWKASKSCHVIFFVSLSLFCSGLRTMPPYCLFFYLPTSFLLFMWLLKWSDSRRGRRKEMEDGKGQDNRNDTSSDNQFMFTRYSSILSFRLFFIKPIAGFYSFGQQKQKPLGTEL